MGHGQDGQFQATNIQPLQMVEQIGAGTYIYRGRFEAVGEKQSNYRVRLCPAHPDGLSAHELGLLCWA